MIFSSESSQIFYVRLDIYYELGNCKDFFKQVYLLPNLPICPPNYSRSWWDIPSIAAKYGLSMQETAKPEILLNSTTLQQNLVEGSTYPITQSSQCTQGSFYTRWRRGWGGDFFGGDFSLLGGDFFLLKINMEADRLT